MIVSGVCPLTWIWFLYKTSQRCQMNKKKKRNCGPSISHGDEWKLNTLPSRLDPSTHNLSSVFLMQSLGSAVVCLMFFLFFGCLLCVCKQITPSEPNSACPSHWTRRWNITQTAEWQGGTQWEKQDEVEDEQSKGWRQNWGTSRQRIGYKMEGHMMLRARAQEIGNRL